MERPFKALEVDWQVLTPDNTRHLVNKYMQDYDMIIGSLHFNDPLEVEQIRKLSVDEFLALYRKAFLELANSGLF